MHCWRMCRVDALECQLTPGRLLPPALRQVLAHMADEGELVFLLAWRRGMMEGRC